MNLIGRILLIGSLGRKPGKGRFLFIAANYALPYFYKETDDVKCLQPIFNENFCWEDCLRVFSAMTGNLPFVYCTDEQKVTTFVL